MTPLKKTEIIKLRCSKAEKRIIEALAEKCGMSLSEYCRRQAKFGKVTAIPKLSVREVDYMHLLKIYSTNFNRLANLIRAKDAKLDEEIRVFVSKLSELQKRIIG